MSEGQTLNAFPDLPFCTWCGDSGIVQHDIWDPPYRWCEASECDAAARRRAVEPNAVEISNQARKTLQKALGIGAPA